ncbi:hypothetical protein [Streptomyces sp. NPDC002122]|uniref:phage tail protein n=1 Tax=Streptomyces sp. NPDC002122 TaxID=3154407 RepID=UPI003321D141
MAANQAEVDLVVNAAGALPDLEQQLSRIIREAENDADTIDVDVAIDTRESVRTLGIQLDTAVRAAEGRLDGVEVGVLIEQREALRTLDRQLTQIVDDTNRRLETTDPVLLQGLLDAPETIRNVRSQVRQVVAAIQATAPEVEIDVDVDVDQESVRRIPDLVNGLARMGRVARTSAQGVGVLTGGVVALSAGVGSLVPLLASVVSTIQQVAPAAAVATQALLAKQLAAGTLKLAMIGVEDAIKRAFDPELSPDEFHKSLKGLAPEARLFVDELHTMRRELKSVQQGVQNRVFRDLDESLRSLGQVTAPVVTAALNQTANSLNRMAKGVVEAANGLSASGILGQALDGATQGLTNLEAVPGRLAISFTTLAAGAAPAFDRITRAIDAVTLRIQEKLLRSLDDGSLQRAIDGAVAGLGQLFTILGNFGEAAGNIFGALTEDGGGLFDVLEKISEAFVRLTASEAFQSILNELVLTFQTLVDNVLPLVQEAFVQLAPVIEELAPVIRDFVNAIGPELIPVIQELGPILVDIAKILQEQLPFAIEFTKGALDTLVVVLAGVHAILQNVVIPIVRLVADVLDSEFVKSIAAASRFIAENIPHIGDVFERLKQVVVLSVTTMAANAVAAATDLKNRFVRAITELVSDAVSEFDRLPDRILGALAGLVGSMTGLGRDAVRGFAIGLASGVGEILSIARGIAESVTSTISSALDSHSPSRKTRKEGQNAGDGLALGLKDSKGKVKKAAEELVGVVRETATAEFSAPATKFFEAIQEQVGRAVGEVFNGPSVDFKAPITKFFENLEIEVGRAVGEVINGPSVDIKGPIVKFFEDLGEAVGVAVGEVINGPSVGNLTKPTLSGPAPVLPTFRGEGTSVVQVYIGDKLIEQRLDDRIRVVTDRQTRTLAHGVRI